jgi:hypothetical protein
MSWNPFTCHNLCPQSQKLSYNQYMQISFVNYIRVITNAFVSVYLQVDAKGACAVKCSV